MLDGEVDVAHSLDHFALRLRIVLDVHFGGREAHLLLPHEHLLRRIRREDRHARFRAVLQCVRQS